MSRPSLYKLPYNQRVLNREAPHNQLLLNRHSPHNQSLLKFMSLLDKLLLEIVAQPALAQPGGAA